MKAGLNPSQLISKIQERVQTTISDASTYFFSSATLEANRTPHQPLAKQAGFLLPSVFFSSHLLHLLPTASVCSSACSSALLYHERLIRPRKYLVPHRCPASRPCLPLPKLPLITANQLLARHLEASSSSLPFA
ncbi:hypothetical protein H0G86_011667 [Trichoderma simmonsii]|uniref:Uncharacterized protein n=1 Tax=Trichoderma simmonsii TaxID=1491479 RepID=A0A8G0LR27_9HYPO|nr:hypothetical protein H0G86_011667 [Trichoderma simmonsii]